MGSVSHLLCELPHGNLLVAGGAVVWPLAGKPEPWYLTFTEAGVHDHITALHQGGGKLDTISCVKQNGVRGFLQRCKNQLEGVSLMKAGERT